MWGLRLAALLTFLVAAACVSDPAPAPTTPASKPSSASLVNGCNRAETPLSSGRGVVEIRFGGPVGYAYEPACLKVRAGTRVRFVGHFDVHPLAPGRVFDENVLPDSNSPFESTREGETATFLIPAAGDVGYYCDEHTLEGMFGAVFVE